MKQLILTMLVSLGLVVTAQSYETDVRNLGNSIENIDKLLKVSGKSTGVRQYYLDRGLKDPERRPDNYLDFALVMPSVPYESLVHFNINDIVSPKSDKISIVGRNIEIPSNFSIPKQRERYIVTIKVNKPEFTSFVKEENEYKLTALHGRFDVSTVVGKLQSGKPIFDLINDFQFLGGGQIDTVVDGKGEALDISVLGFELTNKMTVTAPDYNFKDYIFYSLPMESADGLLNPTDVKFIKPGQSQDLLINSNSNDKYSLNVISEQILQYEDPNFEPTPLEPEQSNIYEARFDKVTLSLTPMQEQMTPVFLDMVDPPKISGNELTFTPPAQVSGITPLATVVELVAGEKFRNGKLISEFKTSLWKKTLPGWISSIDLPSVDMPKGTQQIFRWEVSFVATSDSQVRSSSSEIDMKNFSHMTKNYLVIE